MEILRDYENTYGWSEPCRGWLGDRGTPGEGQSDPAWKAVELTLP